MKNLILKILMLCLTALTVTFTSCQKKSRSNTAVPALPKQLVQHHDVAVAAPQMNKTKEIVLETRKDTNLKESLFSINEELRSKNEGLFFIGRKNDPGQAVTFIPKVQVLYPEKNKVFFRKISDPAHFEDFKAEEIANLPLSTQSDTEWKEGGVYLGEFVTKFFANKKAHKSAILIRVDEWDNNAEKVKLSYRILSFRLE